MTTAATLNLVSTAQQPVLHKRFTCLPATEALKATCAQVLITALVISSAATLIFGAIAGAAMAFGSGIDVSGAFFYATGLLTGFQLFGSFTDWLNDKGSSYQRDALKLARIDQIYSRLCSLKQDELRWEFSEHDISIYGIDDFTKVKGGLKALTVGLAHFIYTKETTASLEEAMHKATEDDTPSGKKLQFVYKHAASISRIHAAFDLHLLKHPFEGKSLSQVGDFTERHIDEIRLNFLNGEDEPIFFFKDKSKDPITLDHLRRKSLASLESLL